MRILIDIGHPAHVHYFKHLAKHFLESGNEVLFTCREKEFEIDLLMSYGFNFRSFGKKYNSTVGKILGMVQFDLKEVLTGLKFKPDLFLSSGSIYAAHAAFFLNKPHISLEDTGNLEQIRIYRPFTNVILTPNVLYQDLGRKQIRYKGYQELLYLHPNRFSIKSDVYDLLKINPDKKYVVLRFVSWNATHDVGHHGLKFDEKVKLVNFLSSRYQLFISSEGQISPEFHKYKINIHPKYMHEILSGASFFIGEGATMAAEAGLLGTPSFYTNSINISYIDDQVKYGTVVKLLSFEAIKNKISEIEEIGDFKNEWKAKSKKLVADKIDVTAFLIWFVENYPESVKIMKQNPDYQLRFK